MLDTPTTTTTTLTFPPATDADGNLLLCKEEAQALLRDCFAEWKDGLHELVVMSIETTNDLFEMNEYVSDADAQEFRSKRGEWVARFEQALTALFEKRLAGKKRSGRRPDFDASLTTLRVLNAFDQEKQHALIVAASMVRQITRREVGAVDMRVGVLLSETRFREADDPLAPDYLLDAIGVTCRALYPNPRIWRPLMERVLADVTPGLRKVYIRVNRFLADRHVLPEIKAELRARSDLRPADDSELLPAFLQLFKEAGPSVADSLLALNIQIPDALDPGEKAQAPPSGPSAAVPPKVATPPVSPAASPAAASAASNVHPTPPGADTADSGAVSKGPSAPGAAGSAPSAGAASKAGHGQHLVNVNPYLVDVGQAHATAPQVVSASGLPQLDPMLALGSLSSAVAVLDRWQHIDPGGHFVDAALAPAQEPGAAAPMPLNRIPFMRAAIADKIVNSTDKITMDVIALLFDYIFRDPSIPETLRSMFGRLQVPILKTALLDRSFFSNKKHPARRLLDHLAAASIGATGDAEYCVAFELIASGIIEEICRDFKVEMAVFEAADARLQEFVEIEQRKVSATLDTEVVQALDSERNESGRAHVRVLIRDKLAGLDVPFDVRAFGETVWADYLTELRGRDGGSSTAWTTAVQTFDELLWSISAKERTAQKARLAKLVPSIIRNLRAGAAAVKVAAERVQPFLETIYQMHMAAIKPRLAGSAPAPAGTAPAVGAHAGTHAVGAPAVGAHPAGSHAAGAHAGGAHAAGATPTDVHGSSADTAGARAAGAPPIAAPALATHAAPAIGNVHDFVNEMVVGTWLAFGKDGDITNARLSWVSPLRSKYIFTSRSRSKAIVVTPEELAWQLGAGKASLVVEPVPLFDRAVSAALDSIAAARPAGASGAPAAAPA